MLLPATAASYTSPRMPDVESAYGTYYGLRPQHTLYTWSTSSCLGLPEPEPEPVRKNKSKQRPAKSRPNKDLRIPAREQLRDDQSERWPDEGPVEEHLRLPAPRQVLDHEIERRLDEVSPHIVQFDTPPPPYTDLPPPYTELPTAKPGDMQQARKKLAKLQPQQVGASVRRRSLARLETRMAAFGHQIKTRWVPAMQNGSLVFLGHMARYDGKP